MTELKPCPFCGSENVYWNDGGWIECRGCNIFFQVAFTNADKDENINWWNTRADRKTESNSEKPNNYEDWQDWKDRMWTEAVVTEPTTQTETQNSNLNFEKRTMRDCYNCKRYETEGECIECHYEPKDEPQACSVNGRPYDCGNCEYHKCTADEPQTEEWYTYQDEQEYNARHGKE